MSVSEYTAEVITALEQFGPLVVMFVSAALALRVASFAVSLVKRAHR